MTLAYIPSPTISQFSIGPVTIHIYALCILMGIVLAVWITSNRWKRLGGNFDQILDITLVAVPSGIVGARLYHIITTPERFFGANGDWVEMFRIWNGGLGIWGGVALGALAAWAWCRHKHYPMALLADAIAPGLLVAQAVGRLGNWFNQELYGAPTTLPWGLKLNDTGTAIGQSEQCYDGATCPSGTLFHPTFLYELIWNLIGAAIIVWIGSTVMKRLKAGSLTVDELNKGTHFIGKKIVEEASETWIAAEYEGADRTAEEMSQLIYHLQVMMIDRGITLEDIYRNL